MGADVNGDGLVYDRNESGEHSGVENSNGIENSNTDDGGIENE